MTTLVTGASGFVGTHLATALAEIDGVYAVGADARPGVSAGYATVHVLDLQEADAVRALLRRVRPAHVIHLVGGAQGEEAALDAINVGTARTLLQSLHDEGIDATTVLLGSAAEYGAVPPEHQPVHEEFVGEPTTPYGRAKREVTRLAQTARVRGQRVTVARPFNIIGPGVPSTLVPGALIARLRAALEGEAPRRITVGRTNGVRDFVAVQDVARGLALLAHHRTPSLAYNLCTGTGHSIQELLDGLLGLADGGITVDRDASLLRGGDVDRMIGDPTRARAELGWSPRITFAESVEASWRAALEDGRGR